jgi:PKD repeat protein
LLAVKRWIRFLTLGLCVGATGGCESHAPVSEPPPTAAQTPGRAQPGPNAGEQRARCIAVASASVDEGIAPLQVIFSVEGLCTYGAPTFAWDFGDGTESADGQMVAHVYRDPGNYIARVTIIDAEHQVEDVDEVPVTVNSG